MNPRILAAAPIERDFKAGGVPVNWVLVVQCFDVEPHLFTASGGIRPINRLAAAAGFHGVQSNFPAAAIVGVYLALRPRKPLVPLWEQIDGQVPVCSTKPRRVVCAILEEQINGDLKGQNFHFRVVVEQILQIIAVRVVNRYPIVSMVTPAFCRMNSALDGRFKMTCVSTCFDTTRRAYGNEVDFRLRF